MVHKQSFTKPRRIIVYVATSADGFIARKDGRVDWLDRPHPKGSYGMGEFFKSVDAVLVGARTYGEAMTRGGGFGQKMKYYVFTHHLPAKPVKGVEFVDEPVKEFAARLRAQPGKDIWIMGGAGLIASFVDAGEVDDFIVHVIPTFIGEGIPLIAPAERTLPVTLKGTTQYEDGVVRLHYACAQPSA
jgi:dihydrofolate reductase